MEEKQTNGKGNIPNQPGQPNQPQPNPNGKKRFNFMWIYAILFAALIGLQFIGGKDSAEKEEIDQGKLKKLLQNQEISKIDLVNKEDAEIYLNGKGMAKHFPEAQAVGNSSLRPNYVYKIGSLDRFEVMVESA